MCCRMANRRWDVPPPGLAAIVKPLGIPRGPLGASWHNSLLGVVREAWEEVVWRGGDGVGDDGSGGGGVGGALRVACPG